MTLEEKYKASRLAKAVDEARLGYVLLPAQDAVMIHDTDYSQESKSEAEQKEMIDWVQSIMEKVLGKPLPREVNVFVDPNAGAKGRKCYCTAATYMVAADELRA
jgi:hypothetical protein